MTFDTCAMMSAGDRLCYFVSVMKGLWVGAEKRRGSGPPPPLVSGSRPVGPIG